MWQSYLYAALMAGSAMRGCRALVIAPSKRAAPSAGAPQMARASGLMKRLLVFGNAMDDYMEREGGILRVGLYAPRQGVGDIAGRMRQAVSHGKSGKKSWKERVYHLNPEVEAVAQDAGKYLGASYQASYLTAKDSLESPKLHLKANFFASARVWDDLMSRPEWAGILEAYIRYLALQQGKSDPGVAGTRRSRGATRSQGEAEGALNDYLAGLSPEQKSEMVCYLTIGSANMDYRSQAINGEVMVTIGGMAGLEGVLDFMLLAGLCDWPGTPEEVDALLPPPGGARCEGCHRSSRWRFSARARGWMSTCSRRRRSAHSPERTPGRLLTRQEHRRLLQACGIAARAFTCSAVLEGPMKLSLLIAGMLASLIALSAGTAVAGQIGGGIHYLSTVGDIKDSQGIDDSNYNLVASYKQPLALLSIEADVEFVPDYLGSDKMLYQPQAFALIGGLIYGGAGIGWGYIDGEWLRRSVLCAARRCRFPAGEDPPGRQRQLPVPEHEGAELARRLGPGFGDVRRDRTLWPLRRRARIEGASPDRYSRR